MLSCFCVLCLSATLCCHICDAFCDIMDAMFVSHVCACVCVVVHVCGCVWMCVCSISCCTESQSCMFTSMCLSFVFQIRTANVACAKFVLYLVCACVCVCVWAITDACCSLQSWMRVVGAMRLLVLLRARASTLSMSRQIAFACLHVSLSVSKHAQALHMHVLSVAVDVWHTFANLAMLTSARS